MNKWKKAFLVGVFSFIVIGTLLYLFFNRKINDYPNTEFDKVVAFKVDEYSFKRLGNGIVLSDNQSKKLISILQSNITYGNVANACFNPRLSFVFYNKNKEIGNALICLECNWMKTNPKLENGVFSKRGNYDIQQLEKEIFKSIE